MIGLPHGRGNAGERRRGETGGNTGNHPEAKPGANQRQGFLAAAPEDKGIAAFEAQYAAPIPRARSAIR